MADAEITNATTASGVSAWKKSLYQKSNQTRMNATDIGWLRNNDSRLNILSELTSRDKQQVSKFRALTDGMMSLAVQSDQNLRVQVHDQNHRTIADSKLNMGKASENYEAMTGGAYDMKSGTYYITVTRTEDTYAGEPAHFAMQLMMGDDYKNDYVTKQIPLTQEQRAKEAMNPLGSILSGVSTYSNAGTIMGDAMSNKSSMFGGVDFNTDSNILGVRMLV